MEERKDVWLTLAALVVAFFSLSARMAGDETARQAGQVIGATIATFLLAAVLWTILWVIARRRSGRPWLSAWTGVIAVVIALVLVVARSAETASGLG